MGSDEGVAGGEGGAQDPVETATGGASLGATGCQIERTDQTSRDWRDWDTRKSGISPNHPRSWTVAVRVALLY